MNARTRLRPVRLPPTTTRDEPLPAVQLRPPRHPRPLSRMRDARDAGEHDRGGRMTRTSRTLRRLIRLAVSGLCLLSLVACVGAGWLWRRSYRVHDRVGYSTDE